MLVLVKGVLKYWFFRFKKVRGAKLEEMNTNDEIDNINMVTPNE